MQKHPSTLKEIAQALNISVSTVSRALQNHPRIGLRTRQRVQEMARQMHYIPNSAAQLLRKHRTLTIGVLLPFLQEEFFSLAITGIEDVITPKGYNVIVSQSRNFYDREVQAMQSFLHSRVDGVIASISAETIDCTHFEALQDYGIPLVFFDRVPKNFPAHRVRSQIVAGTITAMQYLLQRGCTKIALLNGPENLEVAQERLLGYQTAIRENGLPLLSGLTKSVDLTQEDTWAKMAELWQAPDRPQAVLAFNDYTALYAMQWCKQHGIVPNQDLVFVGFANLPILTFIDNPPVASVEQFAYRMGEKAAEILMQILEQERFPDLELREIMIETRLIVHEPT
ncbi:MAG: LacI family DNA-binding transcriptional regulator [Saprospiraceae bacterium]